MTSRNRVLLGVAFVFSVAFCGFGVGTWVGGRFYVPAGNGLAGPAIAVVYGTGSAIVVALIATALAVYLPARWLLGLTVSGVVAAALLLGIAGNAYLSSQAQLQAHLEAGYTKPLTPVSPPGTQ